MKFIQRDLEEKITSTIKRGKNVLLLGPRQTGKTTLVNKLNYDAMFSLADVRLRLRYEKNPGILANEIEALAEKKKERPLIIIDEVQKIPILMDVVQDLIDRKIAFFILTGSSARKLKRGGQVNLLPGRVISIHMDPLMLDEIPKNKHSLKDILLYGTLPEIILIKDYIEKEELLDSYVTTYLEEEIRMEALVRSLGSFSRFLELAASESGNLLNLNKLSQEIGVTHATISNYYQILVDCLVTERVEPLTFSKTRRKLTKSNKYLFFDLGVRRLAAKEGLRLPQEYFGHLFEQFIGLELIHIARNELMKTKIRFWRDPDGPEVDWVIEKDGQLIPIEVKWTDAPTTKDIKHIQTFLTEYKDATKGFVICQTPNEMKLADNITAISWKNIKEVF